MHALEPHVWRQTGGIGRTSRESCQVFDVMARDLVRPHVAVAKPLRFDDFDSFSQREAMGQRDAKPHDQPKAMIAMLEKTKATPTH